MLGHKEPKWLSAAGPSHKIQSTRYKDTDTDTNGPAHVSRVRISISDSRYFCNRLEAQKCNARYSKRAIQRYRYGGRKVSLGYGPPNADRRTNAPIEQITEDFVWWAFYKMSSRHTVVHTYLRLLALISGSWYLFLRVMQCELLFFWAAWPWLIRFSTHIHCSIVVGLQLP